MKQNVKEFLTKLAKILETKGCCTDHYNSRANILRVAEELKKIADGENHGFEKELDDGMIQTIWINLRFAVEGRDVTDMDHKKYAWLIYELVRNA